jgi:hypothetical protein
MAKVFPEKKIVLIRDWAYSSYTGKHMSYVSRAIPDDYIIIGVKDPSWPSKDIRQAMVDDIIQSYDKFFSARTRAPHIKKSQERMVDNLRIFCRNFHEPINSKELKKYLLVGEKVEEKLEKIELSIQKSEERKEAKLLELREEADRLNKEARINEPSIEEGIRNWRLTGKRDCLQTAKRYYVSQYSLSIVYDSEPLVDYPVLRIKDNRIQTSHGAYITIEEGHQLWDKIKRAEKIMGMRLSQYPVVGWNGELVIGCHHIPRKEMRDFLVYYEWATKEEVESILPDHEVVTNQSN